MSEKSKNAGLAVGLDVGTSRIVTARKNGGDTAFRSELNTFVNLPYSRMTENALSREGLSFARKNGDLVVHGNESVRFASLLGTETRRPMTGGILNPAETENIHVINSLVDCVLGKEDGGGRPLFFAVPSPALSGSTDLTYHSAALRGMLSEKGYSVQSIDEGLAVIYSELEDTNYTGIGVSCGGGLCNVCLAYLSMPVIAFSLAKAGDFIDASAASVTGEGVTRIRLVKEREFKFNGSSSNKALQALNVYYEDVIESLVDGMKRAFSSSSALPKFEVPTPIVLSGGTSMPEGFAARFEKALRVVEFPVPVSEVRTARNPLEATANGALIAALAEC